MVGNVYKLVLKEREEFWSEGLNGEEGRVGMRGGGKMVVGGR